jgi:DNA-directed RNA polymerase specialized sigma24 family protein
LKEAIRLAQQGDAAAFETIYQLHCRRVYALCLRMVGDPTEAEDLTQEAFLQLFRKIHTFRGESAFSSWLHRYRSMFLLHDVQGFEHNEIATMLGCSVGNSKSQLHKARKRLRELLHEVRHYAAHTVREMAASGV